MTQHLSGAIIPDRRAFGMGALASLFAATRAKAAPTLPSADEWPRIWPPKEVIPLWPDAPPGRIPGFEVPVTPSGWTSGAWPASFLRRTAMPTLNVFRPARANGEALLVCPGGAYVFVSAANEGVDVARLFNALGVTVFVLNYRLPGEGWQDRANVPLQDAQRAMRLIRSRAPAFGIRPERVGVLGFSAGGHLAATLAVDHAEQLYRAVDGADRESARPAYAGLIYPVILTAGPLAHARSQNELLGPAPSPELAAHRSPNLHVSGTTPPCFLAHAADDTSVPVENSLEMYAALRTAKIKCEGHFFAEGQHAFGIGRSGQPSELWPQLFDRWMRRAHGSPRERTALSPS
jgi:acetyl esterase/lipase